MTEEAQYVPQQQLGEVFRGLNPVPAEPFNIHPLTRIRCSARGVAGAVSQHEGLVGRVGDQLCGSSGVCRVSVGRLPQQVRNGLAVDLQVGGPHFTLSDSLVT